MIKTSEQFIESLLRDKKLKLKYMDEDNRVINAAYNAKREIITSDIDELEKQISNNK